MIDGGTRRLLVAMAACLGCADSTGGSYTYHAVTQTFSDSWPRVYANDPGFTCCTDITAAALSPTERIDLVLYRGKVRPEAANLTGLDVSARTAGGLLPSDHVGVATTLTVGQ